MKLTRYTVSSMLDRNIEIIWPPPQALVINKERKCMGVGTRLRFKENGEYEVKVQMAAASGCLALEE